MPAAFYEFTIEQSSNFASALKVLNPNTGKLFKFLPTEETNALSFPWTTNDVTFDVPDEIKLVYPNNDDSFGWLKGEDNTTSNNTFLTIRMQVKPSTGPAIYNVSTTYGKVNVAGQGVRIQQIASTPTTPFFDIRRNNPDHNILLSIPYNSTSGYTGKYLYDIELQYQLGKQAPTTSFVLRLLQGRMIFNKNITTQT